MNTPNRLSPADLLKMDDAQKGEIPATDLALMLDDLDDWKAELKELEEVVRDAALIRLAADEKRERSNEFGDVTLKTEGCDRSFTISRPKSVKWDSDALSELASKIEDKPGDTITTKTTRTITDAKLKKLPAPKRKIALTAATTSPGAVKVKANKPKED